MREIGRAEPSFDPVRARIGVISLASDEVGADEIRAICAGPNLAVFETRIANDDAISEATLRAMADRLEEAAGLLPAAERYAAVGYLCTSASMLIGEDGVAARVNRALPDTPVMNPMSAVIEACRALGLGRVGLIAPYVADVTAGIADALEAAGIAVPAARSFFVPSDARVARIQAPALLRAAEALVADARGGTPLDGVVMSCTALRTVHEIAALEDRLGVPVVTSNQAVAHALLRAAGGRPAPGRWGAAIDREPAFHALAVSQ